MTAEPAGSWSRLDTLFGALLELEDARRDSFVAAIGEDDGLHSELRRLLDAHRKNGDEFLRPLSEIGLEEISAGGSMPADVPLDLPIPEHRIIGEVHRGGQGIVYKAEHEPTGRIVAIKVIRHGGFASPSQHARFDQERRIIARLHHPNIVTLYHTGELPCGRVAYTMEFVDGLPMHRWLRHTAQELPIRARLDVFLQICAGIAYAHRHGVVHRDLKPSNIIIDANGAPRVVDFGLAKLLESTRAEPLTLTGEIACTPEYAAPEQLSRASGEPDQRTDVYALGVLLYELIAGVHPYRTEGSVAEMLRYVLDVMPPSPATLSASVDADLARVVMKCLAKEPAERYQSVDALRDDLRRYLNDEPISARAPSALYHARKFARRHRRNLAVTAVGASIAITAITAALVFASREAGDRARIATTLEATRLNREIERGRAELRDGQVAAAEDRLFRVMLERPVDTNPAHATDPHARAAWWALWELYASHPCLATYTPSDTAQYIALDRAGAHAAIATSDAVLLFDLRDRVVEAEWREPDEQLAAIAFDDDGALRGLWCGPDQIALRTFGAPSTQWLEGVTGVDLPSVALSANGRVAAAIGTDGTIIAHRLGAPDDLVITGMSETPTTRLALDSTGSTLAWRSSTDVGVVELASGAPQVWPRERSHRSGPLAVSPDAPLVASTYGELVTLYSSTQEPRTFRALSPGQVNAVGFDPGTRSVWSAGYDRRLTHRHLNADLESEAVYQYIGHRRHVVALSITSDALMSGDVGGTLKLWEKAPMAAFTPLPDPPGGVHGLVYDATGARIAIIGGAGPRGTHYIRVDGPDGRTLLDGHTDVVAGAAFTPDGRALLTASYDRSVRFWNLEDGTSRVFPVEHTDSIHHLELSPDGRFAVTASNDMTARIWDVASGRCLHALRGHANRVPQAVFAPDGLTIVTTSTDGTVRRWNVETGEQIDVIETRDAPIRVIALSRDGAQLVTGGDDGAIVIHDLTTGATRDVDGHTGNIFSLAFDPTGCCLVSATREGEVILWDVQTTRRLATLFTRSDSRSIFTLAFSPAGDELLIGGEFGFAGRLDLMHYARHIAGNLEHELDLLEASDGSIANAPGWRTWAEQCRDAAPAEVTGADVACGSFYQPVEVMGTAPMQRAAWSGR